MFVLNPLKHTHTHTPIISTTLLLQCRFHSAVDRGLCTLDRGLGERAKYPDSHLHRGTKVSPELRLHHARVK